MSPRTLYPHIYSDSPYTMQQPGAPAKPTIEMSLREHLLAAGAGQPQPLPQHPQVASPPHAIDPAIGGPQYAHTQMGASDPHDGDLSEGRNKGRRELSQSKRAAQNRAAQRAFRQRKEEYIKQLKDQVKESESLVDLYKTVAAENYSLRNYVINLQSRLLEARGEVPPVPAGIDLSRPHADAFQLAQHANAPRQLQPRPSEQPQQGEQHQSPNHDRGGLSERQIGELQMAAQAAAVAAHGSVPGKHLNSDANNAYDAGDYADKRQKGDDAPNQGEGQAPDYETFVSQLQQSNAADS